ncbi:MAG: hypothetical protein ACOC85_02310 [Thermoplasmatota archaeon]
MDKKCIFAIVFGFIAVILLLFAFVSPWYNINMDASAEVEDMSVEVHYNIDAYLTEARTHSEVTMDEETETETNIEPYEEGENITRIFNTTRIFTVLGTFGSGLGIIGAVLVGTGKIDKRIGALMVFMGFIFAIITPLYLMSSLPPAIQEDIQEENEIDFGSETLDKIGNEFFGSDSREETMFGTTLRYDVKWGGSTAWFLALGSSILNLLALALLLLRREKRYRPSLTPHLEDVDQITRSKEEQYEYTSSGEEIGHRREF